jgi:hypothetical protein
VRDFMCFLGLHFWCEDPVICGLFAGMRWWLCGLARHLCGNHSRCLHSTSGVPHGND